MRQGKGQRSKRWLTGNGIDPGGVRWFVDKRTGDNLNRPAFEQLQAAIFAGEVGTVACYKLDRLSRSLRDGVDVLSDWCERGLRVVSVTQQIDFNGTVGKMLAAVLLGIAQMEQETRRGTPSRRYRRGKETGQVQGPQRGHEQSRSAASKAATREGADDGRNCRRVERVPNDCASLPWYGETVTPACGGQPRKHAPRPVGTPPGLDYRSLR